MRQSNQALTITELAKRWSVSRERVKAMIEQGRIIGAFVLPSAGRFGRAIKIPMSAVISVEENWQIGVDQSDQAQKRKVRTPPAPRLDHFPELLEPTEPVAGYPAAAPSSGEHNA